MNSSAEKLFGIRYSDLSAEQRRVYWKVKKQESNQRHPDRVAERNLKARLKQKEINRTYKISKDKIVKFINELAWQDVKWDALQSTMGEFPASPSAIPRYAKKYFDLWKEMFGENLGVTNEEM